MLLQWVGVLQLAALGMGQVHVCNLEHASQDDEVGNPLLIGTQTMTTTVHPIATSVPSSSNFHGGWQGWSSYITTSTSTTTVTVTVSALFLNTDTGVAAPSTSSSFGQSSTLPSTTRSPMVSPSIASTTLPTTNTSLCIAQTKTYTQGPYNNSTRPEFNETSGNTYFGFNVVNQKPHNPSNKTLLGIYKSSEDWESAFALLKRTFPLINAIRMYSMTDGIATHLMNAVPAAQKNGLMILAGVWSGTLERFEVEKKALQDVIVHYGCGNIAAVSVGNEDLNSVNVNHASDTDESKDAQKEAIAYTLINQIGQVRNMIRGLGYCNVPITHTDTWNEFSNTSKSYIPDLINACDEAAIVNIFPYWSESSIETSPMDLETQFNQAQDSIRQYGKNIWLGETGWARSQPSNLAPFNMYGTNTSDAQKYFDHVGCPILSGDHGSAFYYVDWDEDAPSYGNPAFGLFNSQGEPFINISECTASQLKLSEQSFGNPSTSTRRTGS